MEHAPQHKRGELVAFQWWFNSLQFSPDWLVAELEGALRLCGNRKDASSILERLAQFSETSPFQAVECFALLLERTDDDGKLSRWPELVHTILSNAVTRHLHDAGQLANELPHR